MKYKVKKEKSPSRFSLAWIFFLPIAIVPNGLFFSKRSQLRGPGNMWGEGWQMALGICVDCPLRDSKEHVPTPWISHCQTPLGACRIEMRLICRVWAPTSSPCSHFPLHGGFSVARAIMFGPNTVYSDHTELEISFVHSFNKLLLGSYYTLQEFIM